MDFAKPSRKGNHMAVSDDGTEPDESGIANANQVNLEHETRGMTTVGFSFMVDDVVANRSFFDMVDDGLTCSALCSFFDPRLVVRL